MKLFVSIFLILSSAFCTAQNWIFQPGTGANNFPIHRFWNDSTNNRLLAVGSFDSIGGIYAPGFAQWDGTSWSTTGTESCSGFWCATFGCIAGFNNDIILGGNFSAWSPKNYVIRWNGSTFDSIGVLSSGSAVSMLQYQNTLVVGTSLAYDTISGVPFCSVAAWDGNNWSDMGNGQIQGAIQSMVVYRDTLYLGAFSFLDGYPYVYRYVNGLWETVGPRFYGSIYNLSVFNDELYAGSYNSGNNLGKAISKYDATTDQWIAPGGGVFSTSGFSEVESMAVLGGRLYAMGDFNVAGGVHADHIAAWDGLQWCGLGNDTTWAMRQIVMFDSSIYLSTGNIFDNASSTQFVEWIGGSYSDTCGIWNTVQSYSNSSIVQLYPNPSNSVTTFQFTNSRQRIVVITDNLGREIWRKETTDTMIEFPASEFSSGLYFYRILEGESAAVSGKFLIQH